MPKTIKWEDISAPKGGPCVKRARVHGGWLIVAIDDVYIDMGNEMLTGYQWRSSLVFVPDQSAGWMYGQ
jgi:hypothetical protein